MITKIEDNDVFTRVILDGIHEVLISNCDKWIINSFPSWKKVKQYVLCERSIKTDFSVAVEKIYLHRVIMQKENNRFSVDHINRNPLDNRRENLRFATRSQNNANRCVSKRGGFGCDHGFRGVQIDVRENLKRRYRAQVKNITIGRYETAEEAARAYDLKAKEVYGEFAYLNFPGVK